MLARRVISTNREERSTWLRRPERSATRRVLQHTRRLALLQRRQARSLGPEVLHPARAAQALDGARSHQATQGHPAARHRHHRAGAGPVRGRAGVELPGVPVHPVQPGPAPERRPERSLDDIDAACYRVHIRDSKGNRDRFVQLPDATQKDILQCEDGLLWMVLQHVLIKGFRRARNFGFLHPNSKRLIKLLQWLLKLAVLPLQKPTPPRPAWLCAGCGQPMQIMRRRIAPAQAPLARPRQQAQAASAMQSAPIRQRQQPSRSRLSRCPRPTFIERVQNTAQKHRPVSP